MRMMTMAITALTLSTFACSAHDDAENVGAVQQRDLVLVEAGAPRPRPAPTPTNPCDEPIPTAGGFVGNQCCTAAQGNADFAACVDENCAQLCASGSMGLAACVSGKDEHYCEEACRGSASGVALRLQLSNQGCAAATDGPITVFPSTPAL